MNASCPRCNGTGLVDNPAYYEAEMDCDRPYLVWRTDRPLTIRCDLCQGRRTISFKRLGQFIEYVRRHRMVYAFTEGTRPIDLMMQGRISQERRERIERINGRIKARSQRRFEYMMMVSLADVIVTDKDYALLDALTRRS